TWTGKIIDKLKQLGLYDKTTVYVTADHGFDEDGKGHKYAPYGRLPQKLIFTRQRGLARR
ncbi:MAG TPA: hypothetical protein VNA25_20080, partial [Phycisphaerae bacterium]|nr:hypothetical protein [Phycisphaerae bacterium]